MSNSIHRIEQGEELAPANLSDLELVRELVAGYQVQGETERLRPADVLTDLASRKADGQLNHEQIEEIIFRLGLNNETTETSWEKFSPHYSGFALNAIVNLEKSLRTPGISPEVIGRNLAFLFRCFDRAVHQIEADRAPRLIDSQVDALRDAAVECIRAAGLDPAAYGYGVPPEVI